MKAAHVDPHLRAAQAAHLARVEHVVADALAQRLGADPEHDPYPVLLAGAAIGVMRATMTFWASSGGAVPLEQLTDAAYQALADGLPEDGGSRRITDEAAFPRSLTGTKGPSPMASATPRCRGNAGDRR